MTLAPVLNQTVAMSVPLHVDIGHENDDARTTSQNLVLRLAMKMTTTRMTNLGLRLATRMTIGYKNVDTRTTAQNLGLRVQGLRFRVWGLGFDGCNAYLAAGR